MDVRDKLIQDLNLNPGDEYTQGWEWRNQQELRTFSDIERRLDEGKIIVVNFETDQWKDMGMYIEKEKEYIYSLWINTEGVPELDSQ